ncbi:hypothetical protein BD779DRAFT_1469417 [Infundibulicybe gibba]|nr:hypothetical protein BD779DRAFT_1469417 [Infundibulicybe gibba]
MVTTTSHPSSKAAGKLQPDITYHPDRAGWLARTARRLREDPSLPNTPLPAGFPSRVTSPLVWEGKDWQDEKEWVYELGEKHLKEIDAADKNGSVLSHIKDLTQTHKGIGGPAYTTDKQVFHTDKGVDIVSLFALQTAAEGGTSRISSSWRVYNELAQPGLTLSGPWPSLGLSKSFLALPRSAEIPPITEAQAEALDTLHFLGEKFSLGLNFQKGDIQYINNLGIFHARDGFKDSEKQTRHLLRLWLRSEELAWETPQALKPLWDKTYAAPPDEQTFALDPVVRTAAQRK